MGCLSDIENDFWINLSKKIEHFGSSRSWDVFLSNTITYRCTVMRLGHVQVSKCSGLPHPCVREISRLQNCMVKAVLRNCIDHLKGLIVPGPMSTRQVAKGSRIPFLMCSEANCLEFDRVSGSKDNRGRKSHFRIFSRTASWAENHRIALV